MKVALVYNYDPSRPSVGGGITYVHNLLRCLLRREMEVIMFGVELSESRTFLDKRMDFVRVLKGSDNWWRFLLSLGKSIDKQKLDREVIIHTHHPLSMYPFVSLVRENPKVCTLHGIPMDWVRVNYPALYRPLGFAYVPLEEMILRRTDIVTTAGPYPLNGMIERHPGLELRGKVVDIPSGVDLDRFRPMQRSEVKRRHGLEKFENVILFLGRLSEQKNIELLLDSYSLVERKLDSSILLVLGKGEKGKELKERASRVGLSNVVFLGEAAPDAVPEIINCSDAVVLSSSYEASPTVVKESLACGVPVVSTNVGDASQIITDRLLGRVLNTYDSSEFADAMLDVIKISREEREEVASRCRELAMSKFGFDRIADKFIEAYRKASMKGGSR